MPRALGTQACWNACQQRLLRLQNHTQDPCPVTRQHCLNMPACMTMQNEDCPGCFLLLLHWQEPACRCLLDGQVQCATKAAATAAVDVMASRSSLYAGLEELRRRGKNGLAGLSPRRGSAAHTQRGR